MAGYWPGNGRVCTAKKPGHIWRDLRVRAQTLKFLFLVCGLGGWVRSVSPGGFILKNECTGVAEYKWRHKEEYTHE
jgi:hypothetical protein